MLRLFTSAHRSFNLQFTICNLQFAIICLLLLVLPSSSHAQNYSYGVPKMQMYVTIHEDGSALLDYTIEYHNQPGAQPKDVTDIGTPNERYDLRNVKAWIDDRPIPAPAIRDSEYKKPGFEVHFGDGTIPSGGTGVLRVQFTMPKMVYQDTTRGDYASFEITPTWFNPQYVVGNTHLEIAVQLPKGVKPEEALYQKTPFTGKAIKDQATIVYWNFPATRMTEAHVVGVSFPKGNLPVIKQTAIDLLVKWFSESPQARLICGAIVLVLWGIVFFRFSGGTGFSVFFIVAAGAGVAFYFHPGWHLLALPLVVVLIGVNEGFLSKRKTKYMPPIAQIEGGGIKRGLTAPEAAVLLELPLGKVLSLVIFGMLKKGILRQVQAAPLVVELNEAFVPPKTTAITSSTAASTSVAETVMPAKSSGPFEPPVMADLAEPVEQAATAEPGKSEQHFRETVQKMGSVMQAYESSFLYLLENNPGKPVSQINFTLPMRNLVEKTAAKMKGFDLKQTKEYYRTIVRRATEQAAAIGDIPQREATIDRNFDWILMDDHYPTVFDYGGGYWPVWGRGTVMSGPSSAPLPDSSSIPGTTSFGDVASSFAGWAENTMGSMASTILPSSLGGGAAPSGGGGFLDLSGADRVTGEIFSALAESAVSGGGSGGGGGGGCACAGCACACACAGGGR